MDNNRWPTLAEALKIADDKYLEGVLREAANEELRDKIPIRGGTLTYLKG